VEPGTSGAGMGSVLSNDCGVSYHPAFRPLLCLRYERTLVAYVGEERLLKFPMKIRLRTVPLACSRSTEYALIRFVFSGSILTSS